jgi:hypothetical protein
MRALWVVLALCAGCGGVGERCDPVPCTVVANPNRCMCGQRFCTGCKPAAPDSNVGSLVEFDCQADTTGRSYTDVCAPMRDGGTP